MDDTDDGCCYTASKRRKSDSFDDATNEKGEQERTALETKVCSSLSHSCDISENDAVDIQNNSCIAMLDDTLPPNTNDVAIRVNTAETLVTSTAEIGTAKSQDVNEGTLSSNNDDKTHNYDKLKKSDIGSETNQCCTSSVVLCDANKVESVSNIFVPQHNTNDKDNCTSIQRGDNKKQDNFKVRINRNRLSFISSSDDDEVEREEGSSASLPQNVTLLATNLVNDQNKFAGMPTSSLAGTPGPNNIVQSSFTTIENLSEAVPSVSNEATVVTTVSEETQQPRRRGNRSARRNYRSRVVLSTPSSSAEEEERENSVQEELINSSNEFVESHSEEENVAESSEMDISLASLSSESQNTFPRHIFNNSSSDSDDDTDEAMNEQMNDSINEEVNNEQNDILQDVLNKPKPIYTWNSTYELMRREHGLTGNGKYTLRNCMSTGFITRFYSSRHIIERMKLLHCLRKHSGCVNCLNFNRSGNLLCSGSDDTRVIIWDWAQNKPKHIYKSGHTENIFQTKFIESSSGSFLDIVSAGRDGQVRRAFVPSSGGKITTTCLYRHRGAVHKIVVCPQNHSEIISVGEDGNIKHQDMRKEADDSNILKMVKANNKKIKLFSISHHPFKQEICVCGRDRFVRVFDKRNMSKTVYEMCPQKLLDTSIPQVTCSVYNTSGSEILASYSDDHIYLFDNNVYKKGDYLHCYKGHYNHRTIKGVNFFGPNSEYVVSGSDCGNIFYWDKNTESILNFMPGDTMGVVNCLEPHPLIPVLATSGLDHNIKIWAPNSEIYPPDLSKLGDRVKRNLKRSVIEEANEADDRQFHYFIRQFLRNARSASASNDSQSQDVPESQSASSSSEDDYTLLEGLNCRTQ